MTKPVGGIGVRSANLSKRKDSSNIFDLEKTNENEHITIVNANNE